MELRRFVDLYASETQEHLRLLNRGILDLESGDRAAGTDDAFRAAHTIKGLSAAMGYRRAAELAHALEDRLATVRGQAEAVDAVSVDALLSAADELERAIAAATAAGPPSDEPEAETAVASVTAGHRVAASSSALPRARPGEQIVRVTLHPDTPIKAARALLVVRSIDRTGALRAHEPADFDDEFDGVLTLILGADLERDEAERAIRSAGEVDSVEWGHGALGPEARPDAPTTASKRPSAARPASLRVEPQRLDRLAEGIGEASVLHARLSDAVEEATPVGHMVDRLGTLLAELQRTILSMRMVPVREVFDRFPRLVRDAARALDKQVEFRVEGGDIELDRTILEEMVDPLVHLLRNAVGHGIESPADREGAGKAPRGTLTLAAERERTSVKIVVIDDGRGVPVEPILARARQLGLMAPRTAATLSDDDLLRLMSQPGFSTAAEVTEVSGRGVGLDAVVARIRSLGGAIALATRAGEGTTFTIRLPLTLALAQALRVRVAGEDYAIPLTHVTEAVELNDVMLAALRGREALRLRDELLPLVRMRTVLRATEPGSERAAVIAEIADRRAALAVDELVGREQILIKTFDAATGMLPYFSGATILADGRPALILDPLSVM